MKDCQNTDRTIYSWDKVVNMLKIELQEDENEETYEMRVVIPCFDLKGVVRINKKDYPPYLFPNHRDAVIKKIIYNTNLESWLSVWIKV